MVQTRPNGKQEMISLEKERQGRKRAMNDKTERKERRQNNRVEWKYWETNEREKNRI